MKRRKAQTLLLFPLTFLGKLIFFTLFFGITSAYAQGDTLALVWSSPKTGSSVHYYKVYRSVDSSDYDSIGTTPDTLYSFVGLSGHTYRVRVSAVDSIGIEGPLSEASEDTTLSGSHNNIEEERTPKNFFLDQNFPNPFNSTTAISYRLSAISSQQSADGGRRTAVTLKIYNSLGEKVRDLVDEEKEPGSYMAMWNGRDNWGREVSSGVYFYRLEVMGDRLKVIRTRKMILLR